MVRSRTDARQTQDGLGRCVGVTDVERGTVREAARALRCDSRVYVKTRDVAAHLDLDADDPGVLSVVGRHLGALADGDAGVERWSTEGKDGNVTWRLVAPDDTPEAVTDGSGCWYCRLSYYHPRCGAPGCSAGVHGRGPEGKTVSNYCQKCRGDSPEVATDGGHPGVSPQTETTTTTVEVAESVWRELRAEAIETDRRVSEHLEVVLRERYDLEVATDGGTEDLHSLRDGVRAALRAAADGADFEERFEPYRVRVRDTSLDPTPAIIVDHLEFDTRYWHVFRRTVAETVVERLDEQLGTDDCEGHELLTDGGAEITPPPVEVGDRVTVILASDGDAEYVEGVVVMVHSPRTIDAVYRVESRSEHDGDGSFERDHHTDTYEFQTSLVYMAEIAGWLKGWDDA